ERARPRKEEREQERDRAERLLAAGEQRQPRDPLAGGAALDPRDGLAVVLLGLGERQPSLPAREERRRDLGEVLRDRREGLREPRLDRFGQLGAEALELVE